MNLPNMMEQSNSCSKPPTSSVLGLPHYIMLLAAKIDFSPSMSSWNFEDQTCRIDASTFKESIWILICWVKPYLQISSKVRLETHIGW
jgi:hypothetical protein